jgi:transcriptional regulator of arginine metabolism
MTHSKIARQSKIKEIISTKEVSSQEELCHLLESAGFETTQATLSRDLHELGIVRIPSENGFKYVFHLEDGDNTLRRLIGMEIINVYQNESTIVVRTMPGRAAGVALYLDRMKNSHIIGTVAGDDSIIIIPDSHQNVSKVVAHIKSIAVSG